MNKNRLSPLALLFMLMLSIPVVSSATPRDKKVKPVKNVILMISDGTSLSTVSLARWYQRLQDPSKIYLNLDPYLSGTILTHSSNAPIGDSAPTTSTFMNGMPSISGFVGTYPYSDGANDIVPVDSSMAYRPLMSLWEAAAIEHGKRVGLVVTCEFPHATPADAIAHSYKRSQYEWIAKQMVNSELDVMIGGGINVLTPELQARLKKRGYSVHLNDINALNTNDRQFWSLYAPMDLPYDLDRNPNATPSLAQMTDSAIKRLDGEEGFVLLVEGSKVDWAAHANDPVGMATELLAFDRAVKVALDFAKRDGNTAVIITSDHGNSGVSIGNGNLKAYDKASMNEVFGALTRIKLTQQGMNDLLLKTPEEKIAEVFEAHTSFPLTEKQLRIVTLLRRAEINKDKNNTELSSILTPDELKELENIMYAESLMGYIASIYNQHMHIGFTTHGHTGEETFLATYAPTQEQRLMGFNTNTELHDYLRELLGIERTMMDYTHEYYAPHNEVFAGYKYTITGDKVMDKVLTVKKGNKKVEFRAFDSEVVINGKKQERLQLPFIYVDKTDLFYLPKSATKYLK